jgi:hypothetical protein
MKFLGGLELTLELKIDFFQNIRGLAAYLFCQVGGFIF